MPCTTPSASAITVYAQVAIPADSFARAVAFAISQPEDVDINEIVKASLMAKPFATHESTAVAAE